MQVKGHHKQEMVVDTDREIKGGWTLNRRVDMKHRQIERGWTSNRTEDWKQIS